MTAKRIDVLVSTPDLCAARLNGRPRDPESGQHRQVVVFFPPTVTPARLAGYLRELADLLEGQAVDE